VEVAVAKKTVEEILRPKPMLVVEQDDSLVLWNVFVIVDGVKRVAWRTRSRPGAHAVADFLDQNPTVARVTWERDGRGD
jgi:O-acetylhomoserine/O-acetylserine sulfhydrylase-like pyridoxal-dependent enzyme